jgi:HAD superfamily hydrolase (TIGR01509 family)
MTALIFDCDGVLAETERHLHLPAFNLAFAELGVPVRWSDAEYGERLLVAGGKERIASAFTPELTAAHGLPTDPAERQELFERLHARKTEIFRTLLGTYPLPARPGIVRLIDAADGAGWRVAVASTSADDAVRAVVMRLLGPELAERIVIFAGDIVTAKKPDSELYELAVARLGVEKNETVVIEDSRIGLVAATGAGLACVVTVSDYTGAEDFSGAALVLSSLGDPGDPLTVLATRTAVSPRGYVTLQDLQAILGPAEGSMRDHSG